MGYADSLLAAGETVVRRTRQHWITLFSGAPLGWLLVLASLVGVFTSNWVRGDSSGGIQGSTADVLGRASAIVLIGGIALVAWQALRWRSQDYLVTNRRVLMVDGVLNKRSLDTSLEKINDAVLEQSWLGRLLDFGDLDILTASESAVDRFRKLQSAPAFKRTMLDQKHLLEVEVAGSGAAGRMPPAGPESVTATAASAPTAGPASGLATAQPGGSSAPSGASGGPASAAGTGSAGDSSPASPEQITDTLARLADLRDRGAISAAEYEAKKAELLSRL